MCRDSLKLKCKNNFLKRHVCQHCVILKTGKRSPFFVLLIQFIDGNRMFSHSLAKLANIPQGKKVGKHTPLNSGGLYVYI